MKSARKLIWIGMIAVTLLLCMNIVTGTVTIIRTVAAVTEARISTTEK